MSETSAWQYSSDSTGIGWLTLDRPGSSANTLGRSVLEELDRMITQCAAERPRGLVIRSGKASGFIAGADIKEFLGFTSEEDAYQRIRLGQRVFQKIEDLPFPTVALIRGFALGGGLELALACRYRIGVDDGKLSMGLPEVKLGIHPGFGGTVRSVRLLGVRAAMDLMLTGKSLNAGKAAAIGLVDRLCSADGAEDAARALLASAPPPHRPKLTERLLGFPVVRGFVARALRRQVARQARPDQYPAPYAMVDLWEQHAAQGSAAYDAEARSIASLFHSSTARNLIRLFMLQDQLKALGGKPEQPVRRVHVVGAGVMGGDIAAWCALRGLDVTLQDRELRFIEPALKRAEALYTKRIPQPEQRAQALARLKADVAGDGVASADLLIEAIFEDLSAKQQLFTAAESRAPAHAVLASNTSSLTLEHIAASMRDPSRLVGIHFFNPVAQMPLVEVVHTEHSHPEALTAAMAFVKRIDKLPLPCKSGPGFLVNRVLFPYLFEAMHAAGEGIALPLIDRCATDFGMPMGPIELVDVVGLDVTQHVGEIISRDLGRQLPAFMTGEVKTRVAARQLGRKSGQGFYQWLDGKVSKPPADGAVPEDLADRLILAMVNECVACLRLGVVANEDHLDAGVVYGTGFAPFRGGPLAYARQRGLAAVVARLRELEQRHGSRFAPDPGWEKL